MHGVFESVCGKLLANSKCENSALEVALSPKAFSPISTALSKIHMRGLELSSESVPPKASSGTDKRDGI